MRNRLPSFPRQEQHSEAPRPAPHASQNQSVYPLPACPTKVLPVAASLFAGGMIGYILPGKPWIMGAIIGLFLGLPKKKKS